MRSNTTSGARGIPKIERVTTPTVPTTDAEIMRNYTCNCDAYPELGLGHAVGAHPES